MSQAQRHRPGGYGGKRKCPQPADGETIGSRPPGKTKGRMGETARCIIKQEGVRSWLGQWPIQSTADTNKHELQRQSAAEDGEEMSCPRVDADAMQEAALRD